MREIIKQRFLDHLQVANAVMNSDILAQIERIAVEVKKALANGNKVLFCGNGGFDCFIVQQLFLSVHPDTPVRLIFSMIPYLGVWSQRNRRFSAGKFYAFRAALWRG